jgi:glycosyltransferase involved in cell wall biosynthesis
MKEKFRVLCIASHPVQYQSPIFHLMAQHPRLDMQVAYCSLQGAEAGHDPGFGMEVKWDIPLLDGYVWKEVPNRSLAPRLDSFWGLVNPGLWRLIRRGKFDAVVIYTGYRCASFWITVAAAKISRSALLFGTDASELRARDQRRWKETLKRWLWPRIFRLANVVIVPSSRGVGLMRSLGIPPGRVVLTPYVVDNDWWLAQSARVDRQEVRRQWQVADDAPVVLFCAKLQSWKRPQDVLRAFARASVPGAQLVYAGTGPLRADLEAEARELGVSGQVHFLGFVNQSQLPRVYRASDLLVLPSEYEPFGVVVNEAMLCGCAVAASDRVGAAYDLVETGRTGFVFPCGNTEALAGFLRETLLAKDRLLQMGQAARRRMETWSPRENIEALVGAVESACHPQ